MIFRKRQPPVGARPGTLVISDEAQPPRVRVMTYGAEHVDERDETNVDRLVLPEGDDHVTWIDVQGLGDEGLLRQIGAAFRIHPLALEDAVNVPQRPKSEGYAGQHLFITRMARFTRSEDERELLDVEQVSLFVGANYVLTLQERHGDVLDPVRTRIRIGKGAIRTSKADYLAYAIIDTVVDGYYPILEALGDRLELLETYMSLASNKQNEDMKVLTIMASIFIPLAFLAGIYGMNFEYMPELHVRWSYPLLLAVVVVVAGIMLVYFHRKGWLWDEEDDEQARRAPVWLRAERRRRIVRHAPRPRRGHAHLVQRFEYPHHARHDIRRRWHQVGDDRDRHPGGKRRARPDR